MNELPIQKLIDLVNFDQEVHNLRIEIKNKHQELESLEQLIDKLEEEFQLTKNKLSDAKQEVARKELEMKELDEAEKKANSRLETAQDPKEYQSFKKEIEYLKAKQHDFEKELLAAWNAVEAVDREYKSKHVVYEEEMKKLQATIASIRDQIDEKQKVVTDSEVKRTEMVQGIPEEWLEKYGRMQSRVSNPVVPVINDACGGCFFKVLAQDMARLTKRALLQCKNCYRFLYLESAK